MNNKLTTTANGSSTSNNIITTTTVATPATTTTNGTSTTRRKLTLPASLAYLANPTFESVVVPNRFFHPIMMFETISVSRLVWYILALKQNGVEYVEASYTDLQKELNLSRAAIHQAIRRATACGYINRLDTPYDHARSRFAINISTFTTDTEDSGTDNKREPLPFEDDNDDDDYSAEEEENGSGYGSGEVEEGDDEGDEDEDDDDSLPFVATATTTTPSYATASLDREHQLLSPREARALAASLARRAEEAIATDMTIDYLETVHASTAGRNGSSNSSSTPAAVTTTTIITTTTTIEEEATTDPFSYPFPGGDNTSGDHNQISRNQITGSATTTTPTTASTEKSSNPSEYQYDQAYDGSIRTGQHFDTDYQRPTPTYSPTSTTTRGRKIS